jgi:hypothetical protein
MSESALDPIRQRDRPPAGLPNGSGSTGAEDRLANVIEDSEPCPALSNGRNAGVLAACNFACRCLPVMRSVIV